MSDEWRSNATIKGLQLGMPEAAVLKFKNLACPVLKTGHLLSGPNITEFREQFLEPYSGRGLALFNSSTTAHEVLFRQLWEENIRNVIFQVNAFPSVCFAAYRAGLKIHFVDVDPITGQMSGNSLNDVLKDLDHVVVHVTSIGGCVPSSVGDVFNIVSASADLLIEDAAHSYGAKRGEVHCGGWADYTVFSFAPTKPLTCGTGGAVLCKDVPQAERLEAVARYGRANKHGNGEFLYPGFSARFTEIDAAVGLACLSTFEMQHRKRKEVAKIYDEKLSKLMWLKPCDMGEGSWYKYPCMTYGRSIEELRTYLSTKKIELSSKIYDTLALEDCRKLGVPFSMPIVGVTGGFTWAESHVCLPMHSWMTLNDAERVADAVSHF